LTPGPDIVSALGGSSELTRLALNVLIVCVVLALVGIPILFGLQRLSTWNLAPTTRVTATRVPTAVPPNGMVAFLGDHLSIAYPSQWTYNHQVQGTAYGDAQVNVFSQDAGTYLDVFTLSSIPSDLLETGIDDVGGSTLGGAIPQPTMTNKRVTYNSVPWVEDDFTVSLVVGNHEVPEQMRVLGTNEGLDTFVVVSVAPQSSFAASDTSAFEPMLQSLRLG
jgi:hypothetical protein